MATNPNSKVVRRGFRPRFSFMSFQKRLPYGSNINKSAMTWLKQKWPGVLLILFLLGEFVYSKDWFFIQILLYVLVLKVLFEADLTNTLRLYLLTAIWGTFISAFGLAIYGNFI